jgi:hypothetical protein
MKHAKINLSKSPFYSVRVLWRGSFLSRLPFRLLIANKISEALGFIEFSKDDGRREVKLRVKSYELKVES